MMTRREKLVNEGVAAREVGKGSDVKACLGKLCGVVRTAGNERLDLIDHTDLIRGIAADELGDLRNRFLTDLTDVREGRADDVIQNNDKRELEKKRKTAAQHGVALLLLQLHNFALLLFQSGTVVTTGVFLFDLCDLGAQLCHCDLIFLLLDTEGNEDQLKDQSEEQKRDRIGVGKAIERI